MRVNSFTLLLLGLLGLLALSAPAGNWDDNRVKTLDAPQGLDVSNVARRIDLAAIPSSAHDLEKRRGRGGASRTSRRPAKKTRPKKKRPTKKPAKKRPTKSKKKRPTKTNPKTPKKSQKPECQKPAPCKGKNCARAPPPKAGASCELKPKEKETTNYKVVLAAAKREHPLATIAIGQSYLLVHRDSRTPVTHKTLILGKVKKNTQGQLDFEATAIDLQWDTDAKNPIMVKCKQLYGAECVHHEIETYQCERSIAKHKHGSFKFAGTARPEFADPETFKSTAEDIIEKNKKYSFFYNNCKKHIGRLQNVVAMPKDLDPAYPDEWEL